MQLPIIPGAILTLLSFITLLLAFLQIRKTSEELVRGRKEINQKIYESLILREIGERIGYELNINRILDTIVDSLSKLLSYSVVSYMLITEDQNKIIHRVHLEETVNHKFLDTMRDYMLQTLNKVSSKQFNQLDITNMVTGTIINDEAKDPLLSLWVTPITINTRGVGVLAIGSKRPNLYQGSEMEVLTKLLEQANRAVNNLESIIYSEKQKLTAMVSSMADGVLMLDKNLNLSVVNPAASKLLGLANLNSPSIFDIARALADKLDLRTKVEESMRNDRVVSYEDLEVGGKISQLLISPVKDSKQNLLGTVVLFHDKTAQKQLERIREEFTAMMVHELRAPLTVVRGTTDMLLRNPSTSQTEQGKELLKTTFTSVDSMLTLVNDLLDVAKIESGKFQIVKTTSNLSDIISERVTFFTQLASVRSITLSADIVEPNLILSFDRERISQVLNNLLSNAIKFTSSGGKITVRAYKITDYTQIKWQFDEPHEEQKQIVIDRPSVLVSVSDTGSGIERSKIPELFSKFKQLHPVENRPGGYLGTGLGLVIAKGIVESHTGKIFLESHFGEGTSFYFTLPLG